MRKAFKQMRIKLFRITTIPLSLSVLLRGQLQFINNFYFVVGVSSPAKMLEQLTVDEGIKTVAVKFSRQISLGQDIKSLWHLIWITLNNKPSIIHTHTPKAGTLGMIAAWLCRVPVRMHTVAGLPLLEARGSKRALLNFVEKVTYACATKVYPNSFGLKEIIIQNNYCKPEKLKVIGNGSSNGINTAHFTRESIPHAELENKRIDFELKTDDFVFIFVGRLVKDKGINELVNAFVTINTKFPSTKLLLVGNYEVELDPLKPETIKEIDANPAIIAAGYQPDVRPFLAVSHALVFPSYREGFPNVPMQALAMEIPTIVTDINGCNEIVIHEQNGLIIPPKNTQAIIDAMLRIMTDQQLYNHLKSNARESIVSRYDQLSLWKLIKEEYDEQLKLAGLTQNMN